MTTTEARDVALLLRAGALAAPMEIVEERTVGPAWVPTISSAASIRH